MLYIKIGEEKYQAKIQTFPTQLGNDAVRVTSDAPLAQGFLVVDDDDNVVTDMSDFKYLYREGDGFKEYSTVIEQIIPAESFKTGTPPSAYDVLSRRISAVSNQVNEITPYEDTKKAYYGEIEKVFYGVPNGNTTVFFDNYTGAYTTKRISDRLIISFPERLKDMTSVTIMVQK